MLNIRQLKSKYITNDSGKKTAVVLSISKFYELMEDIEDLASVAERREESTMTHKKLIQELTKDGLI